LKDRLKHLRQLQQQYVRLLEDYAVMGNNDGIYVTIGKLVRVQEEIDEFDALDEILEGEY
jgi:hypothetical protein